MVVRRFRHHVETHNWFAVAVDLLIVVVGVFLGAQATNWNERRVEHDQSVSYRTRLIDELDFNAGQFAQQRAYYQQVRGHALAVKAALGEPETAKGQNFLVDAYQSTQIDITPGKRFIYDEMVSSGLVDRLGSEKVQAQASDYYLSNQAIEATYNADIPPYRALMRTLIPEEAQAVIRGSCGDLRVIYQGRVIASRLPDTCEISLDPKIVAAGTARIRREPGLQDALNRYLSWVNEKVGSLQRQLDQTRELRAALAHVR
jgi:hypothetical protein